MQNTQTLKLQFYPRKEFEFVCARHSLKLGKTTRIMGILNLAWDSFSKDGIYKEPHRAKDLALQMEQQGADIIDIGGVSTRPGAPNVCVNEEKERVLPALREIAKVVKLPISIDTTSSEVAYMALNEGASIINDISGLKFDYQMSKIIAQFGAGCILMHIKGTPQTMQNSPFYASSLIEEIIDSLKESIAQAQTAGIDRENIIIDPGIGFGKTTEHNLKIIKKLNYFSCLELPVLIGTSRKSFIGDVLNLPVEKRLFGSAGTIAVSILNGAHIVRVHDVQEMVQLTRMIDAILNC